MFIAMLQRYALGAAAVLLCAAMLGACSSHQKTASVPDEIDFNWHVRPVLSDNCFRCHGPDAKARKAGLRLDLPDTAYGELPESPGKHAIVPGNPDKSELIKRITAMNPDDRMPPLETHKKLTDDQIELLRAWIDRGAKYKPHWAFIPPEKSRVPKSEFNDRAANEIDRFVFARLQREGLKPSVEAGREALINRVSLTLTGLPPTLAEVDAFVADKSPNAYEKVVDRLLASPAYGERMTSYWMDLARWAETDGFLDDHHDRLLWPWRDWVINAFNNNMPFDQFGTAQLAGDLTPSHTKDQLIATAFLRVGKRTTENGAIDEEYRIESVVDRTDTVGNTFLGLTVGCARCHDHKYDPISHKDYYSFSGFFNSADEPGVYAPGFSAIQAGPTLPWMDQETEAKVAQAQATVKKQAAAFDAVEREVRSEAAVTAKHLASQSSQLDKLIQASLDDAMVAYYPFEKTAPIADQDLRKLIRPRNIAPRELVTLDPIKSFKRQTAGLNLTGPKRTGPPPPVAPQNYARNLMVYTPNAVSKTPAAVLQAPILKEGAKGKALFFDETNKGFLGMNVGWYDRTDPFSYDLWFYAASKYQDIVPIINHQDEQNSGAAGYGLVIDKGHLNVYLTHSRPANMISITAKDELPLKKWTHIALTYDGSSRASGLKLFINGEQVAVDIDRDHLTRSMLPMGYSSAFDPCVGLAFGSRFRVKSPVGSGLDEIRVFNRELTPLEVNYLHAGKDAANTANAALATAVENFLVATNEKVSASRLQLTATRQNENRLVTLVPQMLAMGDLPTPRKTYRLDRGLYSERREELPVQGLNQIFAWSSSLPHNRTGLAQWIFDPKNPLTARVFVNRIWQMHFGSGLVETSENFGAQGSIPSHPELLDWLAVRFVESGWDIKQLHKLIVMSATYCQSSDASDELIQRDPNNQLLARGVRQRMPAEMVRDNALAAAGLLVKKLGGPSVYPYQPEGVWDPLITFYEYPAATDVPADEHHRRSLYSFVKRNAPHPGMQNFDFADRSVSTARRRVSNTPLQALELMNDPQFVEAYRVLADHAQKSGADPAVQLKTIFRLARRELPTPEQLELMRKYYEQQVSRFDADLPAAAALLKSGVMPVDPAADIAHLAALTNVTALVMNTPDANSIR